MTASLFIPAHGDPRARAVLTAVLQPKGPAMTVCDMIKSADPDATGLRFGQTAP